MSTNGIVPERVDLSACVVSPTASLTGLRRGVNGSWVSEWTLSVSATLPDGRIVMCSGLTAVAGRQRGRKHGKAKGTVKS